MAYKVGDKVSFLNEPRDGIVKKIINAQMVSVEIEEGFEIPVLNTDLVKTGSAETKQENRSQPILNIDDYYESKEVEEDTPSRDLFIDNRNSFPKGIYLAYIPENKSNLASGNMKIVLLNNTEYETLFTYARGEGSKFIDEDYDLTNSETSYNITEVNVSQINEWSKLKFQVLFFDKGKVNFKKPLVKVIELNPVKIYKENSYKYCSLIDEKCILMPFEHTAKDFDWEAAEENNTEVEEKGKYIKQKLEDENKPETFPQEFIVEKGVAEVDIHIWKLTSNYRHMTNGEIVTLQKNYFRKYLDSAIENKLKKIVFIHGVGNGKLKAEIRKTLDDSYSKIEYRDASMAKYGVGATEVIIPFNYKT